MCNKIEEKIKVMQDRTGNTESVYKAIHKQRQDTMQEEKATKHKRI